MNFMKTGKSNAEVLGGILRDIMEDERKRQESTEPKYPRRPNKRKDKTLERLHEDIGGLQRDIEITKAKEELKRQQGILESLKNPKPKPDTRGKFEKLRDSAKTKLSDPKTKKNLKTAGLITLGVGAGAGLVAGGLKLRKKAQERKRNQEIKEQIAGKEEQILTGKSKKYSDVTIEDLK